MFRSLSPLASQVGFFLALGWAGFRLWRVTGANLDRFLEQERNTWDPQDGGQK